MVSYLIPFAEGWLNKAVILRGTASKARSPLKVNKPWQFRLLFGRFDGLVQPRDTSSKQPQCAIAGLTVVQGYIKEQLGHTKLS
jgi:hypothetical protein